MPPPLRLAAATHHLSFPNKIIRFAYNASSIEARCCYSVLEAISSFPNKIMRFAYNASYT